MTHDRATRLLSLAAIATALFGLAMFATVALDQRAVFEMFLDLAILPIDGADRLDTPTARLLTAISGGLLTGLGVMIWQVVRDVYARDPETGGRIILRGVLAWFVIDSAGSVLAGAAFNVLMNSGFLALFLVPLFGRRAQGTQSASGASK
ncbi:excinuclease ABC subunit A [Ruegeria sp. PrR005]|uniref:Excinuclease ABC subunit A n=1 Tax=Ruegeria sp. PrR005 TaxID=2706882 RepID=A0A6B2NVT5_9RHOB|nr:excinuclease ABC subunit A [Ruegeria sp. PrR005]NDW47558.1 excinuclease ABC subunit A [Ruegeria sp. PrR005]